MKEKDPLGARMKERYEHRYRYYVPRRTYSVIRVDGKAFHTYTRGFRHPYDLGLMRAMDETAKFLCEEIQGARMAYVQSDEISVLLADFDKITTDCWFDGNIQKMSSVAASLATGMFNSVIRACVNDDSHIKSPAFFDARVFCVPDPIEVANYFVWRQTDATRNSVNMAASAVYGHKALEGKSNSERLDMILANGVNWNDYPDGFKRGRVVVQEDYQVTPVGPQDSGQRTRWAVSAPPVFTRDTSWLKRHIPIHPDFARLPQDEGRVDGCVVPRCG